MARRPTTIRTVIVAAALVALGVPGLLLQAKATPALTFGRFGGVDRDETAALIAKGTFLTADTVLLARDDKFPDALAGSFLAGQPASPILLTGVDTIPAVTSAAIASLKTKNVVLLGGTSAISTAVENELKATSSTSSSGGKLNVTRIGGTNRYDTARLVATSGASVGGDPTAIVSSGTNFPDALAGGPMAFAARYPVLLTDPSSLSPETKDALSSLSIKTVLLLGGPVAVSSGVEDQITANGIAVKRIAGIDRTETATKIASYELANLHFRNNHVDLALGQNFPDALAGGPHAGYSKAPILLTASDSVLGSSPLAFLQALKGTLTDGDVFGGIAAIQQAVVDQATGAGGGGGASLQTIHVSPNVKASPHFSTSSTSGEGLRTCTATVSASVASVAIALFPPSHVSFDQSGNTVFVDADGNGIADLTASSANGVIKQVNGSAVTASNIVGGVTPVNGAVSFVIDSAAEDEVEAVVFADSGSHQLALSGSGTQPKAPSEAFGVGCHTRWIPDDYHPGPIINGATVLYVDRSAHLFVGKTGDSSSATFHYVPSDNLSAGQTPPSNSYDDFEADLSPDDSVQGSYFYGTGAPSQLNLNTTGPFAPTSPMAAEHGTSITLSWTPSTTPDVDTYQVLRCLAASCTYAPIGTTGGAESSFIDSGLTPDTGYLYKVRSVFEGYAGGLSTQAGATARATDHPLIEQARVTTDAGTAGTADAGDVHTFVFSEPMNSSITSSTSAYQVQGANGNTAQISCNGGGLAMTNNCSLSSDGKTLTVTLTTGTITNSSLTYPLTVTGVTADWKDAGGTSLDLQNSPDKTIEKDTTPPTLDDARATTDAGIQFFLDKGDVHRFIFSEPMSAPTTATEYGVSGSNTSDAHHTDAVWCDSSKPTFGTCSLNSSAVTINGTTYQPGQVLTITIGAKDSTSTLKYPLTITAVGGFADAAGNALTMSGVKDNVIEVPTS